MRYLITGGSGYIGTRLVDLLARREDTEKIVIADVVPPQGGYRRRPSSSGWTSATAAPCTRRSSGRTRTCSCTSRSS